MHKLGFRMSMSLRRLCKVVLWGMNRHTVEPLIVRKLVSRMSRFQRSLSRLGHQGRCHCKLVPGLLRMALFLGDIRMSHYD